MACGSYRSTRLAGSRASSVRIASPAPASRSSVSSQATESAKSTRPSRAGSRSSSRRTARVLVAGLVQQADQPGGRVGAAPAHRRGPQRGGVPVKPPVAGRLPEPRRVQEAGPGAGRVRDQRVPQRGRPGLLLAGLPAVLVERASQPESGTFPGRNRREPCDPAVPSGAGPGQPRFRGTLPPGGERSVRPVFPVGGGWRSGQAAGRGLLQQAGRQRPGVAEAGDVHRRGEDRPAARVAAGAGVAAQQPGHPGQVLGDLPVRAGRGRGGGQHRVAAPGRLGQLGRGESGRHVQEPAAVVGTDRGRVIERELVQSGEHPPGQPGWVARAAPRADRGDVGVPLPGPDSRHHQVAVLVEQVVQAVQRGRAAVRVRVPAQLAQPQHGPGRDARLEPRGQRRRGPRVFQRPLRQQLGDRLPGGPGGAGAGLAADHHQPAVGHRRRQYHPQPFVVRPPDVRRQRATTSDRVHTQLGRRPLPGQAGIQSHDPIVRSVPSPDGGGRRLSPPDRPDGSAGSSDRLSGTAGGSFVNPPTACCGWRSGPVRAACARPRRPRSVRRPEPARSRTRHRTAAVSASGWRPDRRC